MALEAQEKLNDIVNDSKARGLKDKYLHQLLFRREPREYKVKINELHSRLEETAGKSSIFDIILSFQRCKVPIRYLIKFLIDGEHTLEKNLAILDEISRHNEPLGSSLIEAIDEEYNLGEYI